jgi:hypothetical protein
MKGICLLKEGEDGLLHPPEKLPVAPSDSNYTQSTLDL